MRTFLIVGLLGVTACASGTMRLPGASVAANTEYASVPSASCPDALVSASKFAPTQKTDSIDGYTVVQGPMVFLGPPLQARLILSLGKVVKLPDPTSYVLYSIYSAKTWLFIDAGPSFTAIADGERMELSGPQPSREITNSGGIMESATYSVTPAQIRTIARAGAVTVRVRGEKGYEDFQLTTEALCSFRRFALDVL